MYKVLRHSRYRLDGAQIISNLIQRAGYDDVCDLSCLEAIVVKDIPAAKHQLAQDLQRNQVANHRVLLVRPLAESNPPHLR